MAADRPSVEEAFRKVAEDVHDFATRLAGHCNGNIAELLDLLKSAQENPAVLRLVMKEMKTSR